MTTPNLSRRRALLAFLLIAAAGGVPLTLLSGIDLTVAGLFYEPGRGFPARYDPAMVFLREAVKAVGVLLAAACVVSASWRLARGRYLFGLHARAIAYLLITALVGPVLVVEGVFKSHWGRARPGHLIEFGGDKTYSPPLVVADQCADNCSFVSGEASYGFYFVTLGFLAASRRRRRALFAAGIGFGAAIGLMRMAQGGHFLSDIFFSGVFIFAVAWLLHYLILERDALAPPARWIMARLGRPRGGLEG